VNQQTISWITKPVMDGKRIVGRDWLDDSGDFYRMKPTSSGTVDLTAQLRGKPFSGEFSNTRQAGHAVQAEYRRREWEEKHG
jgi:hypothetical protein